MNDLQVFNFNEHEVRTVLINNEPYFVGKDVAEVLGYAKPTDAVRKHVDEEDRGISKMGTPSGIQEMTVINESGLYSLVLSSKLPSAKAFKRWVTSEVIPSIRKTGGYTVPKTYAEALRAYADTVEKNEHLQLENKMQNQLIKEMKPKADYYDDILKNKGLVTITQIAKDYGMSGKAFNEKLHELGIQYKQSGQWLLYSKYQNNGYTHSETHEFTHKDGRKDISMSTKFTQKGRIFLYEKLKQNGILPMIEREEE